MRVCRRCALLAAFASAIGCAWALPASQVPAADANAAVTGAQPVDAVEGLVAAFETHQVVAFGEHHQSEQAHALLRRLVRDPRFARQVDDVVVEFGNARYQSLMDAFVAGVEVPAVQLRKVWQDTTLPHGVWDVPVYEEFFRAVRAANGAAAGRKLRVLLGDPPIDWSDVDARRLREWNQQRDTYPAELIEREVLRRNRKALIVYGFWHLRRADEQGRPYATSDRNAPWLALFERHTGVHVLSVAAALGLEKGLPVATSWPAPSIAFVEGTMLARSPFMVAGRDTGPAGKLYDAVLYLGPEQELTFSMLPLELLRDSSYQQLRMSRMALSVQQACQPFQLARQRAGRQIDRPAGHPTHRPALPVRPLVIIRPPGMTPGVDE